MLKFICNAIVIIKKSISLKLNIGKSLNFQCCLSTSFFFLSGKKDVERREETRFEAFYNRINYRIYQKCHSLSARLHSVASLTWI